MFKKTLTAALLLSAHISFAAEEPPSDPPPVPGLDLLDVELGKANVLEETGNHAGAAKVLEDAIKTFTTVPPGVIRHAGELRFFAGEIDASIALFDKMIEVAPDSAPFLWQRGLSLYYAERYKDGVAQFEIHQEVNPNDVENAAWHFICVTRAEGFEAAQKKLIPIKGDSRIPMAEIHDLFAGKATPEDVLKSASREEFGERDLRNHLCYAHLYLGLYFEAKGDADKAKDHIKKAAVDYKMEHYMGKCAQVHYKILSGKE